MDVPVVVIASAVLVMVLASLYQRRRRKLPKTGTRDPVNTMVVIGAGGHASEMFSLISSLDLNAAGDCPDANTTDFNHRLAPVTFVVANDDKLNQDRVRTTFSQANLVTIRRSRSVGQSYLTSVFTTLWSLVSAVIICLKTRPQLVLSNGPGTCIPLVVAARLLSPGVVIMFVESFCRTKTLSLSGKIVYHLRLADHLLVQWPELKERYPKTEYIGLLV